MKWLYRTTFMMTYQEITFPLTISNRKIWPLQWLPTIYQNASECSTWRNWWFSTMLAALNRGSDQSLCPLWLANTKFLHTALSEEFSLLQ
jgi:hypothetical protein